ncbi:MAG: VWA domain-containing protein [Bacteroidetes bacterium]|nr:VWA domain-containing protein [Bacteroidota bacterium]
MPSALLGQGLLLTGVVTEGEGTAPVADATVHMFLGNVYGETSTKTNSAGEFQFEFPSELSDVNYSMRIDKEGFYRLSGSVRPNYGEGPKRHFRLYKREVEEVVGDPPGPSLLGAPVNNLVFLIDVSGSMSEQNRLEDLKESLLFLVDLYRPEDMISIITYSSTIDVVLEEGRISEKAKIKSIIHELQPAGTTQGVSGLVKAYDIAVNHFLIRGNNKVVMATDGIFGEDKKSRRLVEESILRGVSDQVYMSIFSFGEEAQAISDRLRSWSDLGRGNYTHISSLNEAKEQIVLEAKGE